VVRSRISGVDIGMFAVILGERKSDSEREAHEENGSELNSGRVQEQCSGSISRLSRDTTKPMFADNLGLLRQKRMLNNGD
jgi:hypothetical protein